MQKCSFVTIIGAPNAGKSTLTNLLVGTKITIVSPKVQTTRNAIKAVLVEDNTQLIFCDTPGIFKPKRNLERMIVRNALDNIGNDMEIIYLIAANKIGSHDNEIIVEYIKKLGKKVILVINKIDKIVKEKLLPIISELNKLGLFKEVFLISAVKNLGVDDLKKYLLENAKPGNFFFPKDQLTDSPVRFIAEEITREKLFLFLQDELPYNLYVETDSYKENIDGKIVIHQTILVAKDTQKKMVIGEGGRMLKKIGIAARKEIAEFLGEKKLQLFLHVKTSYDFEAKFKL
jgi:GTP-binding protein Era